jgi:hypothetical protein
MDKAALKTALAATVNKVPQSINSASVEVVRRYLETVKKAKKALASDRASLEQLQNAYNQLLQYK